MQNWKNKFPKENRYFETENGILYCGDCLEIMKKFPEKSIDLILTDPPFGTKQKRNSVNNTMISYNDDTNLEWLFIRLRQVVKTLKSNRIMYVLLDYRRVHHVAVEISKIIPLTNEIIWKIGWISGFKAKTRKKWVYNHNTILQFGIYDKFEVPKKMTFKNNRIIPYDTVWDDIPSILQMSFTKKSGHPDEKPIKLFERLIFPSMPLNGIVLDIFLGSGTTAIVCEKLGRKWIGIEINEKYCEIVKKRIQEIKSNIKEIF